MHTLVKSVHEKVYGRSGKICSGESLCMLW